MQGSDNPIGSIIECESGNKYKIVEFINSGNFSDVFKGIDLSNEKRFAAIKVITKSIDYALGSEIPALEKLKGKKNIVEMLDKCVKDDKVYIIFEYMEGSLNNLIKKYEGKGIPVEQCRNIHYQIALGMMSLYSKKLSHRDIHPKNILYSFLNDDEMIVKLADFGVSTVSSERMHSVVGRIDCAPKEVIDGDYSNKCDLYNIGHLLEVMVTGNEKGEIISKATTKEKRHLVKKMDQEVVHLVRKLKEYEDIRLNFEQYFRHPFIFPKKIGKYNVYNNTLDNHSFNLEKESYGCVKSCSIIGQDNKSFAIKKLYVNNIDELTGKLENWKKVSHRNMIGIEEWIIDEGFTFVIMDKIDDSLDSIIESNDMIEKVQQLMNQIASVVQFLKNRGLMYKEFDSEYIRCRVYNDGEFDLVLSDFTSLVSLKDIDPKNVLKSIGELFYYMVIKSKYQESLRKDIDRNILEKYIRSDGVDLMRKLIDGKIDFDEFFIHEYITSSSSDLYNKKKQMNKSNGYDNVYDNGYDNESGVSSYSDVTENYSDGCSIDNLLKNLDDLYALDSKMMKENNPFLKDISLEDFMNTTLNVINSISN